jgi:hypothetical protein
MFSELRKIEERSNRKDTAIEQERKEFERYRKEVEEQNKAREEELMELNRLRAAEVARDMANNAERGRQRNLAKGDSALGAAGKGVGRTGSAGPAPR